MPDGIIGIAIDIGLIREAQRRIEARRALSDIGDIVGEAASAMSAFTKAVMDIVNNLDDPSLEEQEEPDAT